MANRREVMALANQHATGPVVFVIGADPIGLGIVKASLMLAAILLASKHRRAREPTGPIGFPPSAD